MSNKRKDMGSISDELRYAKRPRPSYEDEDGDFDDEPSTTSNYCEKPRNDPVYGQKNAFPGLDGPGADEILYGPPEDGIEYLRMVR
jgi:regulator of vacuolar morphogenesis